MVLAIGFVLLVSLVVSAGLAAAGAYFSAVMPVPAWTLEFANSVFSLAVFTGVFALIYRVLPDERITWSDTLLGAAFTSVLFTLGKYLIGLYFGRSDRSIHVRRRGIVNRRADVGVLLGADILLRCGVHACFRHAAWVACTARFI